MDAENCVAVSPTSLLTRFRPACSRARVRVDVSLMDEDDTAVAKLIVVWGDAPFRLTLGGS